MKTSFKSWGALLAGMAGTLAMACAGPAAAAEWPTRPVEIVVPFPAGGGGDTLTRLITDAMTPYLGQQIVVRNLPGAGGNVGAAQVARAKPDGYTLLSAGTWLLQSPHLYSSLGYDVMRDLAPVSQIAIANMAFFASRSLPAQDLPAFVALARGQPGKISFGSYGVGTSGHLYGEALNRQAGLDMLHVPYAGGAKAMTDLLGGQIQSAFVDMGSARPYFQSDKVKVLAVSGSMRSPLLKDVPTFAELGYNDLGADGWIGFFAPAGTPEPVLARLSEAIAKATADPAVAARLDDVGYVTHPRPYDEFGRFLKKDAESWKKIIQASGVQRQ